MSLFIATSNASKNKNATKFGSSSKSVSNENSDGSNENANKCETGNYINSRGGAQLGVTGTDSKNVSTWIKSSRSLVSSKYNFRGMLGLFWFRMKTTCME